MDRVVNDIKLDTDDSISLPPATTNGSSKNGGEKGTNGVSGVNGTGKKKGNGRGEDGQSLALPKSVVEEGVRITRDCLESVCEFHPWGRGCILKALGL
jgi:hypothetical protein